MGRSQMQKGVSTHIGDICPGTSHEEHLHNVPVTVHAGIVKGSKAMLITARFVWIVCAYMCEEGEYLLSKEK